MRLLRSLAPILGPSLLITGCATITGDDPGARTPGAIIDDEFIERIAHREISKADERLKAGNVDVISFNGIVLLTGQVESEELKAKAQSIVEGIRKARKVHNEIEIGGPTSMVARTNDSWLTTKVKLKLVNNKDVDADRVKVVTVDGVVYLMGLVPRGQAELAVDVSRSVFGVQKIVKVFEYVD